MCGMEELLSSLIPEGICLLHSWDVSTLFFQFPLSNQTFRL